MRGATQATRKVQMPLTCPGAVHSCPHFFTARHEIARVLTLKLQKTNNVKSQKHHLTLGLKFFILRVFL
jgi:hypothetical protein